jgi:heme-degrading monooxygenase HmoA
MPTTRTPRFAVIFVSQRTESDGEGYGDMAVRMEELVHQQPGFIGMHSVRNGAGKGITIAYWESLEAIQQWRDHVEHAAAQRLGRSRWYEGYEITVAEICRTSTFGDLA